MAMQACRQRAHIEVTEKAVSCMLCLSWSSLHSTNMRSPMLHSYASVRNSLSAGMHEGAVTSKALHCMARALTIKVLQWSFRQP